MCFSPAGDPFVECPHQVIIFASCIIKCTIGPLLVGCVVHDIVRLIRGRRARGRWSVRVGLTKVLAVCVHFQRVSEHWPVFVHYIGLALRYHYLCSLPCCIQWMPTGQHLCW